MGDEHLLFYQNGDIQSWILRCVSMANHSRLEGKPLTPGEDLREASWRHFPTGIRRGGRDGGPQGPILEGVVQINHVGSAIVLWEINNGHMCKVWGLGCSGNMHHVSEWRRCWSCSRFQIQGRSAAAPDGPMVLNTDPCFSLRRKIKKMQGGLSVMVEKTWSSLALEFLSLKIFDKNTF